MKKFAFITSFLLLALSVTPALAVELHPNNLIYRNDTNQRSFVDCASTSNYIYVYDVTTGDSVDGSGCDGSTLFVDVTGNYEPALSLAPGAITQLIFVETTESSDPGTYSALNAGLKVSEKTITVSTPGQFLNVSVLDGMDNATASAGDVVGGVSPVILGVFALLVGLALGVRYFKKWIGRKA